MPSHGPYLGACCDSPALQASTQQTIPESKRGDLKGLVQELQHAHGAAMQAQQKLQATEVRRLLPAPKVLCKHTM